MNRYNIEIHYEYIIFNSSLVMLADKQWELNFLIYVTAYIVVLCSNIYRENTNFYVVFNKFYVSVYYNNFRNRYYHKEEEKWIS